MSRPQKMHKPLKGSFNLVLSAVAMGSGKGKRAAVRLAKEKEQQREQSEPKKP
jgi:hypothetical protein